MPREKRTREEQELFYGQRNEILYAITDVKRTDPKAEKEDNEKAMAALKIKLEECDSLKGTCGHLAGLFMRREAARMGLDEDALRRPIEMKDIKILGAALRQIQYALESKASRDTEQTPEIIRIRQALARVSPVPLVYAAFWGGDPFSYKAFGVWEERFFGGIPENKRPTKLIPVRRGNSTNTIEKIDYGIYDANMKRVYEILKKLEKDDPVADVPVEPGDKKVHGQKVHSRQVDRAGEADFFLRHLPPGLKPWAQPKADGTTAETIS